MTIERGIVPKWDLRGLDAAVCWLAAANAARSGWQQLPVELGPERTAPALPPQDQLAPGIVMAGCTCTTGLCSYAVWLLGTALLRPLVYHVSNM